MWCFDKDVFADRANLKSPKMSRVITDEYLSEVYGWMGEGKGRRWARVLTSDIYMWVQPGGEVKNRQVWFYRSDCVALGRNTFHFSCTVNEKGRRHWQSSRSKAGALTHNKSILPSPFHTNQSNFMNLARWLTRELHSQPASVPISKVRSKQDRQLKVKKKDLLPQGGTGTYFSCVLPPPSPAEFLHHLSPL